MVAELSITSNKTGMDTLNKLPAIDINYIIIRLIVRKNWKE